jgi:hypothetical protein
MERGCDDCRIAPVMRCGRCSVTRCARHALVMDRRCDGCERDWQSDAPARRSAKLIFVPPVALLCGGILFGLLLPLSLGGAVGVAFVWLLACAAAVGAGTGASRLLDRTSRAMFLRERTAALPAARLLPSPRQR